MGLRPLFVLIVLAYYRWAMSQIDPLHPDVPEILLRINDLERERAS